MNLSGKNQRHGGNNQEGKGHAIGFESRDTEIIHTAWKLKKQWPSEVGQTDGAERMSGKEWRGKIAWL